MTTTRVSEFEQAYEIEYSSEFGHGHGSLDSKKDLIDDDDARV